jgi:hypothetical protein
MTDRWTVAAAFGTGLFVAWQAFETRRATNANRRAVQASQAVAVDAARARIDEHAPRLQVSVDSPSWPPLEPSVVVGGEPNPQPAGKEWHFPRDAKKDLMLRVQVWVKNLGARNAQVRFEGSIRETSGNYLRSAAPVLLRPNEELTYFMEASFRVDQ